MSGFSLNFEGHVTLIFQCRGGGEGRKVRGTCLWFGTLTWHVSSSW